MRINFKKIGLVTALFFILWLILSYSSMIKYGNLGETPRKHNIEELETQILSLERRVNDELLNSNKLLTEMKKHLKRKKTENNAKDLDGNSIEYSPDHKPVLPVLVISCDRVTVSRCLDNLIKYRPDAHTFPIIVSQDCGHNATYQVIKSYVDKDSSISVVQQPDLSEIVLPRPALKFRGYYKIARHFKFALGHVLDALGHEAVIIVEDDLDISPDFFEYFLGTYPLLHRDPSIWCVSAWNDNGKESLIDVNRGDLLHRTDFFPGLGWMMRRETWRQMKPKWPEAFFDDWLRNPENVDGRSCIRPEISRTYSFGKVGVSKGLFFDMHLKYIQLNTEYIEFTKLNLTYLMKNVYDEALETRVYSLKSMKADRVIRLASSDPEAEVRVPYKDTKSFKIAAKKLGLMDDFRSGVPRTAYRGIVQCYYKGRRIYLTPDFAWTKYDPSWG